VTRPGEDEGEPTEDEEIENDWTIVEEGAEEVDGVARMALEGLQMQQQPQQPQQQQGEDVARGSARTGGSASASVVLGSLVMRGAAGGGGKGRVEGR
jgi:hypothetical protein